MRDIREELQERVNFIAGQINLAQGQFDKLIEQLKLEHDSKLHNLKSELELVRMVPGSRSGGLTALRRQVKQSHSFGRRGLRYSRSSSRILIF